MARWISVFSARDAAQAGLVRGRLPSQGAEAIVIDERPGPCTCITDVLAKARDGDIIGAHVIVEKHRST